jgi:hypothetical protein
VSQWPICWGSPAYGIVGVVQLLGGESSREEVRSLGMPLKVILGLCYLSFPPFEMGYVVPTYRYTPVPTGVHCGWNKLQCIQQLHKARCDLDRCCLLLLRNCYDFCSYHQCLFRWAPYNLQPRWTASLWGNASRMKPSAREISGAGIDLLITAWK